MDIVLAIGAIWVCLMAMAVFTQTRSYGYLMISLGAALTLSTFSLMDSRHVAELALIAGRVLFWGGLAVTATFGSKLEKERLRTSSWKEIFLGKVPGRLQTQKVSEEVLLVQSTIISLLFAVIFYGADRKHEALSFLVIGVVFLVYLVWRRLKQAES